MLNPVSLIKDRLPIAEVIGGYMKLERTGPNFRARCPFHNEKTPSFFVSVNRNSFYCFGCHKGGDIFTFVQEIENVDFKEALNILAQKAGVAIGEYNKTEFKAATDKQTTLKQIMNQAVLFYQRELGKNTSAIEYLKKRGLTKDSVLKFKVGYAPSIWDGLSSHLLKMRFAPDLIIEAGLALRSSKDNSLFDRFRGRIMFPLFDQNGQAVGFTGRLFDNEATRTTEGKYVNSPQTPLYDKSKLLYGFNLAKPAIREADAVVLVEGQMDLIMSHQAGVTNAVAVSGTALTPIHLKTIKNYTSTLKLAFDADVAGFKAGLRALALSLVAGLDARVIAIEGGKDPADLILVDEDKWKKAVTEDIHVIEYYLKYLKQQARDERELGKLIEAHLLPIVKLINSALDQAYFIKKISDVSLISEAALTAQLKITSAFDYQDGAPQGEVVTSVVDTDQAPPLRVQTGLYLAALLSYIQETNDEDYYQALIGKVEAIVDIARLATESPAYESYISKLLFEFEVKGPPSNIEEVILSVARKLRREDLKEELQVATNLLKAAEEARDEAEVDKLLKKCQDITQDINKLTS
jgi:DNA primase